MLITSCEARSGLHQLQAQTGKTAAYGQGAEELLRMLQTKLSHLIALEGPAATETHGPVLGPGHQRPRVNCPAQVAS